jgi:hypothetical protein
VFDNPSFVAKNEYKSAREIAEKVTEKLKTASFLKVAIASEFVREIKTGFAVLTDLLRTRLFHESIGETFGKISDLAFTVTCAHPKGWSYGISVGPMKRSEWFRTRDYRVNDRTAVTFADQRAFDSFQESIPKVFLYSSVTCESSDVKADKLGEFIDAARDCSLDVASRVDEHCCGGKK